MTRYLWLTALIFSLFSGVAQAHRVNVFAYQEGNKIEVESSFSGGRPCMKCAVEIIDPTTSESVASGQTDARGRLSLPLPQKACPAGLKVVLKAGAGHQASWLLEAQDLTLLGRETGFTNSSVETPAKQPVRSYQELEGKSCITISRQELTSIVDQSVSRQLAPLKRMMLKSKGPDLRDIIGSIGYLVGIAGIIAWLRSRRNKR